MPKSILRPFPAPPFFEEAVRDDFRPAVGQVSGGLGTLTEKRLEFGFVCGVELDGAAGLGFASEACAERGVIVVSIKPQTRNHTVCFEIFEKISKRCRAPIATTIQPVSSFLAFLLSSTASLSQRSFSGCPTCP